MENADFADGADLRGSESGFICFIHKIRVLRELPPMFLRLCQQLLKGHAF